ncbi:UNVERIFIED_CONTAM: hypothetical protein HDU68_007323 [Siphonaria sp. JEL0065]|nr:hypothetical protein HDU68_007323 [Siphonaria sp. JEL0065]
MANGERPNNPPSLASTLVSDRVRTFWNQSPLTSLHVTGSVLSHTFALVGVVPLRAQSFHPRLALGPAWQLHRVPWSVLVLGRSLPQIVGSVVSLVTWHSQLESLVCGSGDIIKNNRLVKRGTNGRAKKSTFEWLVKDNAFLKIQIASLIAATALEMLLYSDPKDPLSAVFLSGSSVLSSTQRAVLVFPYSLFPIFDAAIRWTWAFTELEKDTLIFGVVPVRPIYVPLVTTLMSGGSLFTLAKGFLVAVSVSFGLKLKRGGKDFVSLGDDGLDEQPELVVDYLKDFGLDWFSIKATADVASAAAGKRPANSSSSRPQRQAETFDINDAAAFFDVTLLPAIGPFVAEARDALVRAANQMVDIGSDGTMSAAYSGPSSSSREGAKRRRSGVPSRRSVIEEDVQMEDLEEGIHSSGYSLFGSSASVSRG